MHALLTFHAKCGVDAKLCHLQRAPPLLDRVSRTLCCDQTRRSIRQAGAAQGAAPVAWAFALPIGTNTICLVCDQSSQTLYRSTCALFASERR